MTIGMNKHSCHEAQGDTNDDDTNIVELLHPGKDNKEGKCS